MARLVLIDDDDDVRNTLSAMLEQGGYEVTQARDGEDAMQILSSDAADIDAVLTDMMMPNMDGIEVIIALRRSYPDIPVIAMSGGARGWNWRPLEFGERFGAAKTLAKPIDKKTLLKAVEDVLSGAS